MRIVSLFSGAGGMDLGFINAGHEIIFANDNNYNACATYKENLNHDPVFKDIKKIRAFPKGDLLIACCPCQGFSLFGNRNYSDKRNFLYKEIIRCLKDTKPKFLILENVKGLLSLYKSNFFNTILSELRKTGYNITYKLINAKDYGVPQDRLRVFIVGIRKDLNFNYKFPKITHGPDTITPVKLKQHINGYIEYIYDEDIKESLKKYTTLKQAIGHLDPPEKNEYWNSNKYSYFYMSRNRRRKWNQVSYTIQASGRHLPLHPSCPPMKKIEKDKWIFTDEEHKYRRLSIKECSLIQSFPEDYNFIGGLESKYRQIGNAVPPNLAYNLAIQFDEFNNKL